MKHLLSLTVLTIAGMLGVANVRADQWDKKTTITIDQPLQLPRTTLAPGTYVIKLLNSNTGERHVVQFFDKDETHLITTILAIPNERLAPTGKSVFAFWETPAGKPRALRAWFYPGDNFGQEFLYPQSEADQIATTGNQVVPISNDAPQIPAGKAVAATSTVPKSPTPQQETQITQTSAPPATAVLIATPAEANQATNGPSSDAPGSALAQSSTPAQVTNSELPSTATQMPLVGLLGLLAIVAFIGMRTILKLQS
jgi:hypothetical protein